MAFPTDVTFAACLNYPKSERAKISPKVFLASNCGSWAKALHEWAYSKGVKLNFIRPGKTIENAYAERFVTRLRDECLNENWFLSLTRL